MREKGERRIGEKRRFKVQLWPTGGGGIGEPEEEKDFFLILPATRMRRGGDTDSRSFGFQTPSTFIFVSNMWRGVCCWYLFFQKRALLPSRVLLIYPSKLPPKFVSARCNEQLLIVVHGRRRRRRRRRRSKCRLNQKNTIFLPSLEKTKKGLVQELPRKLFFKKTLNRSLP